MTEKQKIPQALIFLAAFVVYAVLFRLLFLAMLAQRAVFPLSLCNIGISLFAVTLAGHVAISSSGNAPRELLQTSRFFLVLGIVSMLSFFVKESHIATIIGMCVASSGRSGP